jgi:hypothetical protein
MALEGLVALVAVGMLMLVLLAQDQAHQVKEMMVELVAAMVLHIPLVVAVVREQ